MLSSDVLSTAESYLQIGAGGWGCLRGTFGSEWFFWREEKDKEIRSKEWYEMNIGDIWYVASQRAKP